MALGPNYWNIGKLTFDDCYHALNDPDRPISSLRTSKALGTQQFQVFLAWPIRSTSSKTITLPATKTAYHLPSLSFDSDWQPHPLSNSSPDSPYRHVFVKASLSCALVELPSSPNSIYSSFKHPNLLTYSTQRVYLPPEAFIPNPKPTSPDTTPDDSSSNQPPTRHYLGFQTCRHQPSYHPETTNPLLNQARYNGGQPRDILEESLNIFYNNGMRCWRPPLKSTSSSPPPPGTNPNPNTHLQPETSVYRPQVCHLCQTRYRAAVYTWPTDPSLPAAKEIVVHVWQNLGSFQEKHGHMKGNFPQSWFAPVGGKMEKGEYTRDARPAFLMGWDARLGAGYWGEYENDIDGPNAIPYCILSHTWGDDEVTFQDIQNSFDTAVHKKGFEKIKGMCELTLEYGHSHAWVDTCCIDKTSSAELTESINSMFHWYQKAALCVVYLEDFALTDGQLTPTKADLQPCRWFTRGWTLQELVAPRDIIFHDCNWTQCGSKVQLLNILYRITSIDITILQSSDKLYQVPVAQKMSWAAKRNTTRIEDMAYCLLGIFGIHMPLIYGEREKAFLRLQEHIAQKTNDMSLFAWQHSKTELGLRHSGILASHPSWFAGASDIKHWLDPVIPTPSWIITNTGLELHTALDSSRGETGHRLYLRCTSGHVDDKDGDPPVFTIWLRKIK
ncbi:uncharacterized protein QC763_0073680 [Podospora pseudopauciseta]|uniref:Heterokaryon incompatibility domain-containing protein n=1 Tax=Podospora pseudopauciseta TaxID=2093780 RepID=A0ABR0H9L4_9PEZI|nr:hypothetical protein QC763_0073680 [Podospora pseudopauciseta]